ncbi:MAG TPA: hypothetical protein VEQ58_09995, partial [Polyangiaceae bacterium]|nr:hypothetical protein [Polyangiaceae bacterium]
MIRKASLLALTLLGSLWGCAAGASDDDSGSAAVPGNGSFAGTSSASAGTLNSGPGSAGSTSNGAGGSAPVVVPPEQELEASFLAPVVTGKYVFSANPSSGRVAVIDAENYAVRLFNAGFGPTYLTAIPGDR